MFNSEDIFNQSQNSTNSEVYAVAIKKSGNFFATFTIVRNNKELATLLDILPTDYIIMGIQLIPGYEEIESILKEIKDQNKPNDMQFGLE